MWAIVGRVTLSPTGWLPDGAGDPPAASVVLRMWGPLDRLRAPTFAPIFEEVPPGRPVTVDLGRVTFIDSAGLRMLRDGILSIRRSGGRVGLRRPSPWVGKVLHIAEVDRLAKIDPPNCPRPA